MSRNLIQERVPKGFLDALMKIEDYDPFRQMVLLDELKHWQYD